MPRYFENCNTPMLIKTRYRELCKTHHPDLGGDPVIMCEINQQYEKLESEPRPIGDEDIYLHKAREIAELLCRLHVQEEKFKKERHFMIDSFAKRCDMIHAEVEKLQAKLRLKESEIALLNSAIIQLKADQKETKSDFHQETTLFSKLIKTLRGLSPRR